MTYPKSLVQWLCKPSSYPEETAQVRLIETHISWVFLTDRFAYKLKKPVRFDFVDFTDAQMRHDVCQEEVRLNRRLTSNVYLAVVPVTRDQKNRLQLDGGGEIVDWLVKMRRLDQADTLLEHIQRQRPLDDPLEAVVATLAAFYRSAKKSAITGPKYHDDLVRHVQANQAALLDDDASEVAKLIRRVHQRQLRFLWLYPEILHERVSTGWIVDGHGDLRPEHIFIEQPIQIIDCIEFSEEYRRLDVADEVCFLTMECDRLGASAFARKLIERCQEQLCDRWPSTLVEFYKAYRACVRAKVAAFRAAQLAASASDSIRPEIMQYLGLADRCAPVVSKTLLIVVGGLMGSGKSTLASALGSRLGIDVVQTDAIRRELFGAQDQDARFGEGVYSAQCRARVYDRLFEVAGRQLADGLSVILDGTFLTADSRARARDLAEAHGAATIFLRCICPEKTTLDRIARRRQAGQSLSDARPELLELQRREEESAPAGLVQTDIDTMQPLEMQLSNARTPLAE